MRSALIEAEPDIVAHMNSDHADARRSLCNRARRLARRERGAWRGGPRRRRFAALHKRRAHRLSRARAHSRRSAQHSRFAGAASPGPAAGAHVTSKQEFTGGKQSCCRCSPLTPYARHTLDCRINKDIRCGDCAVVGLAPRLHNAGGSEGEPLVRVLDEERGVARKHCLWRSSHDGRETLRCAGSSRAALSCHSRKRRLTNDE